MFTWWFFSSLALFAGPLLFPLIENRPSWRAGLDGLLIVALGGLVLFHLLPESVRDVGWMALVAAVLGLVLPLALHGLQQQCSNQNSLWLQGFAATALILHAALDGMALEGSAPSRGAAIAAHRLVEGFGVWWLVRPLYGRHIAIGALLGLAYASFLGVYGAAVAAAHGAGYWLGLVQAAVAGSLLHVLLRHAPRPVEAPEKPVLAASTASCLGGGVGLLLLWGVGAAEASEGGEAAKHFTGLLMQTVAPALMLALAGNLLWHATRPPRPTWSRGAGGRFGEALRGALQGACTDACSCGLVPIYQATRGMPQAQGLLRPASSGALGFLATAPALGLTGFCASVCLFGWTAALGRFAATVLLGASVGGLAGGCNGLSTQGLPPQPLLPHGPKLSLRASLADAWHFVSGEVVDTLAPWSLLGLALAANFAALIEPSWLVILQQHQLEVPLLILAAAPLYLSSLSATLVAAALMAKGASSGAVMGICLVGPAVGLTVHRFVQLQHGRSTARRLSLGLLLGAILIGYGANAWVPMPLQPLHRSSLGGLCVVFLAGLFLRSILAQGVRPFVGQIAVPKLAGGLSFHHDHGIGSP